MVLLVKNDSLIRRVTINMTHSLVLKIKNMLAEASTYQMAQDSTVARSVGDSPI